MLKGIKMENSFEMSQTEIALAQHPYLAILTSITGFLLSFLGSIVPVLQVAVLVASLVLTCLTIEAKWKERKLKGRKKINDK